LGLRPRPRDPRTHLPARLAPPANPLDVAETEGKGPSATGKGLAVSKVSGRTSWQKPRHSSRSAQHKAYRAGRFVPRYTFGTSLEVGLDEKGEAFEIHDVTDQDF
jgi:hypothetical protein